MTALIGGLKWCPKKQLEALAELAQHGDVYGYAGDWTAAIFEEMGIILGGLNGGTLREVKFRPMEGWTMTGIIHIPPEHLKVC